MAQEDSVMGATFLQSTSYSLHLDSEATIPRRCSNFRFSEADQTASTPPGTGGG